MVKIHRDGDFFDYPGERHADSIIKFAEKMSSTAVAEALSYDAAIEVGSDGNGVVFVAYDPAAKGQTVDEKLQSSLLLQVFGQIARKQQAHASFALISAETKDEEVAKFGAGTEVSEYVFQISLLSVPMRFINLVLFSLSSLTVFI